MKKIKELILGIPQLILWVLVLLIVASCKFASDILSIGRIIIDALDCMPRHIKEHLLKELER